VTHDFFVRGTRVPQDTKKFQIVPVYCRVPLCSRTSVPSLPRTLKKMALFVTLSPFGLRTRLNGILPDRRLFLGSSLSRYASSAHFSTRADSFRKNLFSFAPIFANATGTPFVKNAISSSVKPLFGPVVAAFLDIAVSNAAKVNNISEVLNVPTALNVTRTSWFLSHIAFQSFRARLQTNFKPAELGDVDLDTFFERLIELNKKDAQNIAAGYYKVTGDMALPPPQDLLPLTYKYFVESDEVIRRRKSKDGGRELRKMFSSPFYPDYYLQNFHYQSEGYLSEKSAELYEYQTEVLFFGGYGTMRRMGLVPIAEHIRANKLNPSSLKLLDVGCGTGRWMFQLKDTYPSMTLTGLDLSPFYLDKGREDLKKYNDSVNFIQAEAENMPLPDASYDIVTMVSLFHELPQDIRRKVAKEVARVLKPGGLLLFMDSVQKQDAPFLDLRRFPSFYHEPYYLHYTQDDLVGIFKDAGLHFKSREVHWLMTHLTFEKPAPAPLTTLTKEEEPSPEPTPLKKEDDTPLKADEPLSSGSALKENSNV